MALDKTLPGIPHNGISEHESLNQAALSALPKMRMLLVGEASLEYLDGLIHAIDSPIKNWHPQDILYLNEAGKLEMCPVKTNRSRASRVAEGWKSCEQAVESLADTTKTFNEVEPKISRYLQDCDWLLLVVALDNPIAFVAGERISSLAREAGVKSVAVMGTPYLDGFVAADGSWNHSDILSVASMNVVNIISAACHCVIPDNGFWGFGDEPMSWGFFHSNLALHLVSEIATRSECCAQISDAITTSGMCMVGCNYSEFEQPKAAIEDAISETGSCYWRGADKCLASSGAIFQIIGNVDKADQMKKEILLTLREPSKILRKGKVFWRGDANFQIVTSTPEYMHNEDFCFIQVLSMCVSEL